MERYEFESLVRGSADDLYRYAMWLCGDPRVAEELVQETFLRAWRGLEGLKDERAAKAWLITILRREHARRWGKPVPELGLEADLRAGRSEEPTAVIALRTALGRLAPEYREPLVLQVVWGFSCQEIAEILGVSRGAVMTRCYRARTQLRDLLDTPALAHGGDR